MIDHKAVLEDCKALRRMSILMLERAIPPHVDVERRMYIAQSIFEISDAFRAAIKQLEEL